jgi:hypothetical protein
MTDGANGLAVVEILESAQRSLEWGRPVEIAEVQEPAQLNGRSSSPPRVRELAAPVADPS